jgi:hypothetical protein
MGFFERRFVRPTHLHVVDVLEQATEEANEAGQAVDQDREQWDAFVSDIREVPEGCHEWLHQGLPHAGTGGVGLAWWTDFLKRRHFRIWAGSSADGSFARLFGAERKRPPMWHIAPENVFGRSREGPVEWLAVCRCGMSGPPARIGWMGTNCGCCHYKPAPSPEEAPVRLSRFDEAGGPLRQLTFSPDGRWLVAAGAGEVGDVHVWDIAAESYHGTIRPGNVETHALAFSPDSRSLAVACGDRLLHFFTVTTGNETAAYPTPLGVRRVVIAPDNLTLVFVAERTLEVWGRRNTGQPWLLLSTVPGNVQGLAFDGRGDRLIAVPGYDLVELQLLQRGGEPTICRHHTHYTGMWEVARHRGPWSGLVAFRDNGQLFGVMGSVTTREASRQDVVTWDPARKTITSHFPLRTQAQVRAFSADASWLAGIEGNTVVVEHVSDQCQWGRLESSQRGPLAMLAFSPDGQTLATADQEGTVKLWPWRRLLAS